MLKVALWASLCLLGLASALGENDNVLMFKSEIVKKLSSTESIGNSTCGKSKFVCAGNQTCCAGLPPTMFACCPYPQGVCCLDRKHCCPKGYHCNVPHQNCYKEAENGVEFVAAGKTHQILTKPKAKGPFLQVSKPSVKSVVCPGGAYQCPDDNTCCRSISGAFGCCPLPQAVCCSDKIHCCPHGYTCDLAAGTCDDGRNNVIPLLRKKPSQSIVVATDNNVNSVVCPDHQSECPDGNTCCKTPAGKYGCCPQPQAVCCNDGSHCCPNGWVCEKSVGGCARQLPIFPFMKKTPALPVTDVKHDDEQGSLTTPLLHIQKTAALPVEDVVCPGGQSQCPSGSTCCKLTTGGYGCCPMLQAVCCSDGVHCCPNGYTCNVGAGTCQKGALTIPLFQKTEALSVENVVCPDGQSQCPSGSTCCKLPTGGYGCCPLPKAVCCSDGVHCCPNGYTCNVGAGTCLKGALTIPMFQKTAALSVENVVCPDGQSQCPSGSTCCKLTTGGYGCCPLPKAVCCSDGVHCCPNGYTCNVGAGTCQKGALTTPLFQKTEALSVENVVCPDGQSQCPSGSTCCKLTTGGYGCCPLPKAVCCSDGVHCCPNGYTCNVGAGTCQKGALTTPLFSKTAALSVESVVCPDGQSQCPSGSTCCKLTTGGYGCCPLPKAVCCSDGVHCCPNGYTCNVGAGTCQKGALTTPLFSKTAALSVENVVCPDGQSQCPSGSTCCKLTTGGYGCCPLPKAVCCSDGVHCCPNGYTCNVGAGTCLKGALTIPLFQKTKALSVENVVCPDGQSQCPSGSTCCKLTTGGYGCCPLPKAVCCSDGVHCCPNGYTCNVGAGTCQKGALTTPLFQKTEALSVENVVCPDGQSQCPSGSTCCKLTTGGYGCCPLPKAVCCSDGVHCCPNGYTCNVGAGTCQKGALTTPLFSKTAALSVESVVCPDGQSQCPSGSTCCKLTTGGYGCCPLPKAVCCSDGVHCCPNGYTCNVGAGTCQKGALTTPLFQKTAALSVESVVCPDGQSQCPSGSTCCKLTTGGYGCCPLPKAVCCSDGVHCCPNGYTCNVGAGTCQKGALTTPLFSKTAALSVENVVCPDGQSQCPTGSTCCKLTTGGYGCCPLPKAVCCSDGVHCCPNGYTCNVGAGTCLKGALTIPLFSKTAALSVESVVCPDGQSQCPSGSTCCKLTTGGYGCCPIPKAECCADGIHCCPNQYTCNVAAGTCFRGALTIPLIQKTEALSVESVVCPDGQSQCPSGSTCCKLTTGGYGCCPLPKAVCCSDGVHCCPNGYTCNVGAGTCQKGALTTPLFSKTAALSVENVVCPDGQSQCPSGSICCKLTTGGYGCCPLPKAVCCSDGVHCCPNGYTCNVGAGTCQKGALTTPLFSKTAALSVENVVCSDGQSQCPTGSTCCKLTTGGYGCCPLPKAVCCSDGVHCCPNGYTCNVGAGTCQKGALTIPLIQKTAALSVESVVCPDGQSQCPSGSTCCKLTTGGYGCCPLPKAVCCSDGVHCCPNGYTCNVGAGTCQKGALTTPLFSKTAALSVENVVCPDGQSQCPSGSTCCKLTTGGYGCCPIPKAECCADGIHCCPNQYTCNVAAGTCFRGALTIPLIQKTEALSVESVVCPDGQSQCPSGSTCCKLTTGGYGCCPLPKAVCCSDGVHCCPNGYTCNVGAGTCQKGALTTPLFQKTAALSVESVVCPDGQSQCPSGSTCCKLTTGGYGCCPLPKAVCCSDGVHCCSNGYTCNVGAGTCQKGALTTPLFSKTAALSVENVVCPDGQSQCPSNSTCCKLPTGSYGCCPIPKAECCADGIHCCPNQYTCNVAAGTCFRGALTIPMFQKTAALSVENVVCPDGQSQCPSGSTCCKLTTGGYGCCPLPKAVCCSDGVHCCPNGYTCNVGAGTCQKGALTIPLFQKTAASSVEDVVCPDGQSQCPSGSTCCKLTTGGYGCCPLPKATCCSDGVHCCPSGSTCDVSAGTCHKQGLTVPFLKKTPALQVVTEENVVCSDGKSECPSGNTCCKDNSGEYGCCPLPKAVCCSDGVHCCPSGYTCDVSVGKCHKQGLTVPFGQKIPAMPIVTEENVVCPDGQSQCPTGNTCCKDKSGAYGCCPMPKAACCSDGVHCCPNGYTCDVSVGKCHKQGLTVPFGQKIPAMPIVTEGNVLCPDGQSQCATGNTCCGETSGAYECCPMPMATCCSDGIHCCPSGSTCDLAANICKRGKLSIPFAKKTPAVSAVVAPKPKPAVKTPIVICPDGTASCPGGYTCCIEDTKAWGCCPFQYATCCADLVNCCPRYFKCNLKAGHCEHDSDVMPFFAKRKALPFN